MWLPPKSTFFKCIWVLHFTQEECCFSVMGSWLLLDSDVLNISYRIDSSHLAPLLFQLVLLCRNCDYVVLQNSTASYLLSLYTIMCCCFNL